MGKHHLMTKEEQNSYDRLLKMLENDVDGILVKYGELGHALTNSLIDAAVKHIVHVIRPETFEGLGYLTYRMNDYYMSELNTKIDHPKE